MCGITNAFICGTNESCFSSNQRRVLALYCDQLMTHHDQKSSPWPVLAVVTALLLAGTGPAFGAGMQQLVGHMPAAARQLQPIGRLAATNELHLGIGVALRDPAGLDRFLAEVYDPASPIYHQYLTPAEFTARFCATEADYAAVKNFALASGFTITGTHGNRLLLDVTARAGDVERAFHLHLQRYQHPTEAREFFAPDVEPSVDAALAVVDIQGLSDYVRPHPKVHKLDPKLAVSKGGSAPDQSGSYFGNDFRNAYVPGTTLTGAGQSVGLFELDGYYANDIAAYASQAGNGRTNIVVMPVMIGSTNWSVGVNGGDGEVSLDIEMAMAIAPGLSKIFVYEADSTSYINTMLSAMLAASNTVRNLSCSWGWGGGPSTTTDSIFKLMAAAGQSFFNASGDSCAFTVGASSVNGVDNTSLANAPSSCPYITQVGATTLTNGAGGAYVAENVWNWGNTIGSQWNGTGSSGGVSSYYPIPSWQTNISMTANLGSTNQRNIPDVALTGDNIYVISGGSAQGSGGNGGTSCAAPLWAGFLALVNQQAAQAGGSSPGLINPAIYAIAKGANPQYSYAACFHEVIYGNNYWSSSRSQYAAVAGYDLCTGLGTPTGTNLINALAGAADPLGVTPLAGFTASGLAGGPFSGTPQSLTLTNTSASSLTWSLINTSAWLTVSSAGGTLAADTQFSVTASLSTVANSLVAGNYAASVLFSNQTTHVAHPRQFSLQVLSSLTVSPASGFTASGLVGGNFSVTSQSYGLTNLGTVALNWGIVNTSLWLTASPAGGTLAGGAHTNFAISLSASAYTLPAAVYAANVLVTNQNLVSSSLSFTLEVGQSVVQNGGFETGDFTGWTQSGNTDYTLVTSTSPFVHSGTYGAELGPSSTLGYLSQTVTTFPGENYLLSFWLYNSGAGSGSSSGTHYEQFQASWNGANVYAITNPPALAWTSLQFIVTAGGANPVLQFGFRNDRYYFGLDDVSLTPIPEPSFTALARTANQLALTWNTLPGLLYVVQYKTNLTQTNWIGLFTNSAAAGTVSFTNVIGTDPHRFYRIWQLP